MATAKRKVSESDIGALVEAVELEIMSVRKQEVESVRIGQAVMRELEKLDHVAYVRFASVYRNFQDVGAFRDIVEGIGAAAPAKDDKQLPLDIDE